MTANQDSVVSKVTSISSLFIVRNMVGILTQSGLNHFRPRTPKSETDNFWLKSICGNR